MPNRLLSFLLSLLILSSFSTSFACDAVFRSVRVVPNDAESQFAKEVFSKAGCELNVIVFDQVVTLERRMDMLAKGQIDLIVGLNKRPDREEYALFSAPFAEERVRLWGRKGQTEQYHDLDLQTLVERDVKIFAPDAGWYGPIFQQLKANKVPQITLYKDFKHSLALLHRGRNDLVLGSENFGQYIPEQYKDISVMLPQVIHTDYLHFMFSKKTVTPQQVKLINKAIKEVLPKSGMLFSK